MKSTQALKREVEFLTNGERGYQQFLEELKNKNEVNDLIIINNNNNNSKETIEDEILSLQLKLKEVKKKRNEVNKRREKLHDKKYQMILLNTEIEEQANYLTYKRNSIRDQLDSIESHLQKEGLLLQKFLQLNSINDAFHIWYSGPFGTINNFRLGRLSTHQIDWTEINSALGEAASAVYTIANKSNYIFRKYQIHPMGCFARISKTDDRTSIYLLYTDGSFSLFPKRNFILAMIGFLTCISELGQYVTDQDPTLQLPYEIDVQDGKINHLPITLSNDEEGWTRALKYLLSDVKWIIAWSTKHLQHLN